MLPLGLISRLPPQNWRPSSMPTRFTYARKHVFSIALAAVRVSKNLFLTAGEAEMQMMNFAPCRRRARVISGKKMS